MSSGIIWDQAHPAHVQIDSELFYYLKALTFIKPSFHQAFPSNPPTSQMQSYLLLSPHDINNDMVLCSVMDCVYLLTSYTFSSLKMYVLVFLLQEQAQQNSILLLDANKQYITSSYLRGWVIEPPRKGTFVILVTCTAQGFYQTEEVKLGFPQGQHSTTCFILHLKHQCYSSFTQRILKT